MVLRGTRLKRDRKEECRKYLRQHNLFLGDQHLGLPPGTFNTLGDSAVRKYQSFCKIIVDHDLQLLQARWIAAVVDGLEPTSDGKVHLTDQHFSRMIKLFRESQDGRCRSGNTNTEAELAPPIAQAAPVQTSPLSTLERQEPLLRDQAAAEPHLPSQPSREESDHIIYASDDESHDQNGLNMRWRDRSPDVPQADKDFDMAECKKCTAPQAEEAESNLAGRVRLSLAGYDSDEDDNDQSGEMDLSVSDDPDRHTTPSPSPRLLHGTEITHAMDKHKSRETIEDEGCLPEFGIDADTKAEYRPSVGVVTDRERGKGGLMVPAAKATSSAKDATCCETPAGNTGSRKEINKLRPKDDTNETSASTHVVPGRSMSSHEFLADSAVAVTDVCLQHNKPSRSIAVASTNGTAAGCLKRGRKRRPVPPALPSESSSPQASAESATVVTPQRGRHTELPLVELASSQLIIYDSDDELRSSSSERESESERESDSGSESETQRPTSKRIKMSQTDCQDAPVAKGVPQHDSWWMCLLPRGMLNADTLLRCLLLVCDARETLIVDARWMESELTSDHRIEGLHPGIRKVAILKCKKQHWILLFADFHSCEVQVFNSYSKIGLNESDRQAATSLLDHISVQADRRSKREWTFTDTRCSQQSNGYDCGIFVMFNLFCALNGVSTLSHFNADLWRRVFLSLIVPSDATEVRTEQIDAVRMHLRATNLDFTTLSNREIFDAQQRIKEAIDHSSTLRKLLCNMQSPAEQLEDRLKQLRLEITDVGNATKELNTLLRHGVQRNKPGYEEMHRSTQLSESILTTEYGAYEGAHRRYERMFRKVDLLRTRESLVEIVDSKMLVLYKQHNVAAKRLIQLLSQDIQSVNAYLGIDVGADV